MSPLPISPKLFFTYSFFYLPPLRRLDNGRAVFLTEDKNDFFKAFEANQSLWWKRRHLWINIGGMWAGVFLLQRNSTPWKPLAPSKNSVKQGAKKRRKMEAAAARLASRVESGDSVGGNEKNNNNE